MCNNMNMDARHEEGMSQIRSILQDEGPAKPVMDQIQACLDRSNEIMAKHHDLRMNPYMPFPGKEGFRLARADFELGDKDPQLWYALYEQRPGDRQVHCGYWRFNENGQPEMVEEN